MLFPITQIDSNLRQIEEIPNTFFEKIQTNNVFSYELFPDWFREFYGNRTNGLYSKANTLFDVIKNSGNELNIVEGYRSSINIETHCLNIDSYLFYCDSISPALSIAASEFFNNLYDSFDKQWVRDKTQTNVLHYIREFKEQNRVFVCPICGNEKIKSSRHEARAALDHWLCKAKYPFSSVNWNNLFPLGEGCNRPPVKGQNEVIWIDNNRLERKSFFYPFNWLGEIQISLECIEEPSIDNLPNGSWKFNFRGTNDVHQDLIDKWDIFFGINNRWIDETLFEFIDNWTYSFADYLMLEIDIANFDLRYSDILNSFKNGRESFNTNPQNRVEWFFLNFLINEATPELQNAYKEMVRDHIKNI